MSPVTKLNKGWGWLVEEFLKKPARMAAVAILSGILITGGNYLVGKTAKWLTKVVNMNQRVSSIESTLIQQHQTDSTLAAALDDHTTVLRGIHDELIEIKTTLRVQGLYRRSLSRENSITAMIDSLGDVSKGLLEAGVDSINTRRPR